MLDQYGNRSFKTHDRVCERHFKEEDINLYWETVIKGEIHRTPRDKARLKDCAIPTQNLVSEGNKKYKRKSNTSTEHKGHKDSLSEQLVEAIKKPTNKKRKAEDDKADANADDNADDNGALVIAESNILRTYSKIIENGERFEITELIVGTRLQVSEQDGLITPIEVESLNDSNEIGSPEAIKIITEEDKNEMIENFDILWDEAFDTTLPSQLWGIQRCPERTFIVFSEFNKSKMKSSKLLYIDNEFQYKILVDDKEMLVKSLEKQEINTEFFSNLLNDFDENRIP